MATLTISQHDLHRPFIRGAQDRDMRFLVGIVGTLTAIILILPH